MNAEQSQTDSKLAPAPGERLAYTIRELAKATGIGRTTLFAEIKAGRLPVVRFPGKNIVTRKAAEQYLAEREKESNS